MFYGNKINIVYVHCSLFVHFQSIPKNPNVYLYFTYVCASVFFFNPYDNTLPSERTIVHRRTYMTITKL